MYSTASVYQNTLKLCSTIVNSTCRLQSAETHLVHSQNLNKLTLAQYNLF